MRRPCLALLLAAALALLGADAAGACTCVRSTDRELLERADVVLAGTVAGVERRERAVLARLRVQRILKGSPAGRRVTVRTPASSAACGIAFDPGAPYLVYARRGAGGALETGLCDGTVRLGEPPPALPGAATGPTEGRAVPAVPLIALIALALALAGLAALVLVRRRRTPDRPGAGTSRRRAGRAGRGPSRPGAP